VASFDWFHVFANLTDDRMHLNVMTLPLEPRPVESVTIRSGDEDWACCSSPRRWKWSRRPRARTRPAGRPRPLDAAASVGPDRLAGRDEAARGRCAWHETHGARALERARNGRQL